MTTCRYGDVVLVPFPFTNLQTTKKRPAVIISSLSYNQARPDFILMAITSQVKNERSTGEYILQDWQQAGLLKPSMIKPLIATLEQNKIVKNMGQLSNTDREMLNAIIQTILGN